MVDVRRFNPAQPRDPNGEWGDGIAGAASAVAKDALKLADRIELDKNERLVSSSRFADPNGDRDLVFAVVHGADENDVRIGLVHPEDTPRWRAANKGGTATLNTEELQRFRSDLAESSTKAKAAAKAADKAWSSGSEPTDPVLLGQKAVAEGRVQTVYADLTWDYYLTDDDPTSWNLEIRTVSDQLGESDPIRLDPKRTNALLKHLDGIQAQVDGPSTPARSRPEEVGGPMAPEGRYNDFHAPAGSADGGQFTSGGSGGGSPKKPAPKGGKKAAPAHHRPAHHGGGDGTLSYDPAANHGTGYDSKNGDEHVHELQQALNRLGVPDSSGKKLKDDGKLGPKTTSAVKALQKLLGLKPDGKVTPDLLKRITSMKSLPAQKRSVFMDTCVRSFGFEARGRGGDGRLLEGYAAVFGSPTRIAALGGDFDEVIQRGAFARSLAARSPVLQWDHGKDPSVGTAPIGDIEELREDDHGLYVRARLYDHPSVDRVRMAIQGRSVKGMSFRFQVPDGGDTWERRSGNVDLRTVADADVFELGPVAFPAYDATTVSVRSLLAQLGPDEHRALLQELAHDLRTLDLDQIGGRPSARSSGGAGTGRERDGELSIESRFAADGDSLRLRGIL